MLSKKKYMSEQETRRMEKHHRIGSNCENDVQMEFISSRKGSKQWT